MSVEIEKNIQGRKKINNMKKLLGLLGTIMITGNAIPSVIAAAPNRKHSIKKRQNNENTSTTPKMQDEQQSQFLAISDSKVYIIEKEITLNKNYSDNIQKMLQELIDENYIDPLRSINMGGLISKELDNKTIISKLEELEPKMADWFKKQQNNKEKILILTLKNSDNKSIKLVINLNNFYLLGFINNQNQYFYFDDELLEKIKQNNQNEITELEKIKTDLEKLNKLIKEKSKDKAEKESLEWKIKEKLNKLKELDKLKEQVKIEKDPEEIKKIENNIKNINKLIKKEINKAKDLNKLNKELIEARKTKNKQQIDEKNKKIEKLKEEILIFIPSVNYNNYKEYLDNKIKNLQGEGLKIEEIKTKTINKKVAEKYNCQKINLNYTGAYTKNGLNVIKKEQNNKHFFEEINISQDILNNAIKNLTKVDNENKQSQEIKNDLVRIIFITSEAMRFQCDEKTLEIFANVKNIKKLEEIMAKNKNINMNILTEIQEKVFKNNQTINWKKYIDNEIELLWNWGEYSEQINKFRIEIWEQLIKEKSINDFFYKFKNEINEILIKSESEIINEKMIEIISLFEKTWENEKEEIDKILKLESNFNEKEIFYNVNKILKAKKDVANSLNNLLKLIKNNIKKVLEIIEKLIDKSENKIFVEIKRDIINRLELILGLHYNKKIISFKRKINFKIESPLLFILDFNWAKNQIKKVKNEIKKDKILVFNFINNDTSLLFSSIQKNNLDIIKLLIKLNINEITINSYFLNIFTPLLLAVQNDSINIIKELLKHPKINVNITNEYGDTPLNIASSKNNLEIVKELLNNQNSKDKIKINESNQQKGVPLFYAIYNNNLEIVKLLIKKGKELYKDKKFEEFINAKNNLGFNPLFVVIKNDDLEIVKLLINNGGDVYAKNNLDINPLDYAKKYKQIKIINILEKFIELNKKINICKNILLKEDLIQKQKTKIENNLQETQKK
ncbi:ankyrin repeat domain-containing protein [Spiroplasma endosymbiont of Ammophila pubescens]|uniref:ankyrin repeat domain-containing protein n=1 Tax=Spiroplasma endosymbiont of Ammophila pubescens TaxID=3066315 RepID=UPI0032B229D8